MSITKDRPTFPDGQSPDLGQVLYDDTGVNGWGAWRDHMGIATPYAPLSYSSLRTWHGSPCSLQLSVSARPNNGNVASALCSAYRNMSREVDKGVLRLESWFAVASLLTSNSDTSNTAQSINISIDSQNFRNTHRGHPVLAASLRPNGGSGPIVHNWWVTADNGDQVYIDVSGSIPVGNISAPSAAASPPFPGENENKLNWMRMALWYDLETVVSADGFPGRYFMAEMGHRAIDLTQFKDSANNPIGRLATPCQITSGVGGGSFAGGNNTSVGMTARGVSVVSPPWMLQLRSRLTAFPLTAVLDPAYPSSGPLSRPKPALLH